jgi:hypothetical protein
MSWDVAIVKTRGCFRPIEEVDDADYGPLGSRASVVRAIRAAFPAAEWSDDETHAVFGGGDFSIEFDLQSLEEANTVVLNVHGTAEGLGAVYRVHYAAHPVYLEPGDPNPSTDLVRVTVFVSWDNKDHGEEYVWTDWTNNLWQRHMVSTTAYIRRHRYWY